MMRRGHTSGWLAFVLIALSVALSGCSDDEGPPCTVGEGRPGIATEAYVEAQTYRMGYSGDSTGAWRVPEAEVTITRGFWIMTTEVTVNDWERFLPAPIEWEVCTEPECPVAGVNWSRTLAYANFLSELEGRTPCYDLSGCEGAPEESRFACRGRVDLDLDCDGWRLPTSAEWELAARGGKTSALMCGRHAGLSPYYCMQWWAWGNRPRESWMPDEPMPVATRCPNRWGVYDMMGNLAEWVWDSTVAGEHDIGKFFCVESEAVVDPIGCTETTTRFVGITRGQPFTFDYDYMYFADYVDEIIFALARTDVGFRLVRTDADRSRPPRVATFPGVVESM